MVLARMMRARSSLATLLMRVAGAIGGALLVLLVANVMARTVGVHPVWVSETSRVLFVWGTAVAMISVSLSGRHFRVDLKNKGSMDEEVEPGRWELVIQLTVCVVLAYIAWFAVPTIERAAAQPMASIPLTYGALRTALVLALVGMFIAHFWRALEISLALAAAPEGSNTKWPRKQ